MKCVVVIGLIVLACTPARGQIIGEHMGNYDLQETIDISEQYEVGDTVRIEIHYTVVHGTYMLHDVVQKLTLQLINTDTSKWTLKRHPRPMK